jgi:RloB-like protein
VSPDRSRRTRPERGKSLIADRPPRSPARIIYVVPEGEVTEPDYCTALNNYFKDGHQFYINTRYSRKNGLHPLEVAEAAVTIASDPREREDNGPVHEVWALFDRDQHTDVREAFAHIQEHNASASANGYKNVQIGFSNPSFDLWLLLHFQQLNNPQDGSSARVHEKLRNYPTFARFASGTAGSKAITADRAEQLLAPGRIESAVRNARALVKQCPTGSCSSAGGHADLCDPLCRDPSTDIWNLIRSLGIAPSHVRPH